MKTFILAAALFALTAVSGVVVDSQPAAADLVCTPTAGGYPPVCRPRITIPSRRIPGGDQRTRTGVFN